MQPELPPANLHLASLQLAIVKEYMVANQVPVPLPGKDGDTDVCCGAVSLSGLLVRHPCDLKAVYLKDKCHASKRREGFLFPVLLFSLHWFIQLDCQISLLSILYYIPALSNSETKFCDVNQHLRI